MGSHRPEPVVLHPVRALALLAGSSHSIPHVRSVVGRHPRRVVAGLDRGRDGTVRPQGRRRHLVSHGRNPLTDPGFADGVSHNSHGWASAAKVRGAMGLSPYLGLTPPPNLRVYHFRITASWP